MIILLLALGEALPLQGQTCVGSVTNLIAWWPGDEHAYDVVNAKLGAIQGQVAYATGAVGQAFEFASPGSRVFIQESTKTDLSRMGVRWTIEAWVKPSDFGQADSATIYSEGRQIISLALERDTGRLESWINGAPANRFVGSLAPRLNEWNHVAVVRNGSTRTLYVNGQSAGSTNATPAPTPDSGHAAIGQIPQGDASTAFAGAIDEVSLHSRALTAEEVAAIHAAGPAGKCFGGSPEPRWILMPESQTNFPGGEVTLVGVAMASPRPRYQWSFKAARGPGSTEFVTLPGATNTSLALTDLTTGDSGEYQVVASSSAGTLSAVAHLSVTFCTEAPAGMVAWWPGDGNGLDALGQHPGTTWGEVQWGAGKVDGGAAFGFNGVDTYAVIPDAAALSPQAGPEGALSVEAWVRLESLPAADPGTGQAQRSVLAKGDPGRWEYGLSVSTTGVPSFTLWTTNGATHTTVAGGQLIPGQWAHLVAAFQSGQFLRLYQDGQMTAESISFTGAPAAGDAPLYLGRRGDGQFLRGQVDEVALYRRALEAGEVDALYAGGVQGRCAGTAGPAPAFVVEPEDVAAYLANETVLQGFASGFPRPAYQWQFDGTNLPDATNATLRLPNLSEAAAGTYTLVASNALGIAKSRAARLTLVNFTTVREGFENGWDGWTSSDYSLWQVGVPTSGPLGAASGRAVAATVLAGVYPGDTDGYLISPAMVLPTEKPGQRIELRFSQWASYSWRDHGYVEISTLDNGSWGAWQRLAHPVDEAHGTAWSRVGVELSAYAGRTVRIGFLHVATPLNNDWSDVGAGWYLDDIEIWQGASEWTGVATFENGWGGWSTDAGIWQVGVPTYGPGMAHGGSQVVATGALAGGYSGYTDSRLVSPAVDLPSVTGLERLELRFWQWASYSWRDYGYVQISVWKNQEWTAWSTLAQPVNEAHDTPWSLVGVDLTAYAQQTVRLAFLHVATPLNNDWSDVGAGWYLDDIELWKGVPEWNAVAGFEAGWSGWSTDAGIWQVGVPTKGPGNAHGGTNVVATGLAGRYPGYTDSRLVSPAVQLPAANDTEHVELRFWQWASYSWRDYGYVQISVWTDQAWTEWTTLAQPIDQAHDTQWSLVGVDLAAYAGRTVRIGFFHVATPLNNDWSDVGAGWYLDDIEIRKTPVEGLGTTGFETGWGGWSTDAGIWQIGSPKAGPKQAHSGANAAGTILDGPYPGYTDSRLVSPPVQLPTPRAGERLELRFWQWVSTSWRDYGYVQISSWTNGTWTAWATLAQPVDEAHYTPWSLVAVDLTDYAGQPVRVAFLHVANPLNNDWSDVGDGWYIDDVEFWRGASAWTGLASFEDGGHGWSSSAGIWQVGVPTSGPQRAHSGSNVVATVLDGAYPAYADSRLVSPLIQLPTVAATERLDLRFWQWASYSWRDYAYVEISVLANNTWGPWTRLMQAVNEAQSMDWTPVTVDLKAYAGSAVRLGFLQVANPFNNDWSDVAAGWYIDDVFIKRGGLAIGAIADATVAEEQPLGLPVTVVGTAPGSSLSFRLGPGAPEGITVDPETGAFSWVPSECAAPATYYVPIYVEDLGAGLGNDLAFVKVTVTENNAPPWLLPAEAAVAPGEALHLAPCTGDSDCPPNPLKYELLSAAPAGAVLDAATGALDWTPSSVHERATPYVITVRVCDGGTPNECVTNTLSVMVTTHAPFALEASVLSDGRLGFTMTAGRADMSYVLQQTLLMQECPLQTHWEDLLTVSPTALPVRFEYDPPHMDDAVVRAFRVKEIPRLP